MGEELRRLRERKRTFEEIDRIMHHPEDALVVHYSCESFYKRPNWETRVTSIAVRNLRTGQTESFSIHKMAQQKGIGFQQIPNHYDDLEKDMLEEYFQYANRNQGKTWIHWNMSNATFGFQVLEERLRVLQGTPFVLPEDKKFYFGEAMKSLYRDGYIDYPRLFKLSKKNKITVKDMLTGPDEVLAFENQDYVRLHQSTLRKVDNIATFFRRTADRRIRTNSKWYEVYGIHPKVIVELIREHWVCSIILGFIALVGSLPNIVRLSMIGIRYILR